MVITSRRRSVHRTRKSLAYLAEHGFHVMSNEVPDELLEWWDAERIPEQDARAVAALDAEESEKLLVLSYVFIHAQYGLAHADETYFDRTRAYDSRTIEQTLKLIKYIREARRAARGIPNFDLFDLSRYDEIMPEIARPDD